MYSSMNDMSFGLSFSASSSFLEYLLYADSYWMSFLYMGGYS